MVGGTLDNEIGRRFVGAGDLRPYTRVGGRERAIGQTRPEPTDRAIESVSARWIDRIVEAVHPLHVRTEPHIARKIDDRVDVHAAGPVDRVYQPFEGTARHAEIDAAAKVTARHGARREIRKRSR